MADEELVSTGRLSIIEDVALRDSISTFYTEYSSIADMSAQMADHSYTRLSRSAVPHEVFHAGQAFREFDVEDIRASFEALRSRPAFADLSNAQLATHIGNTQFMRMYGDLANDLLAEIAACEGE